MMVTRRRFLGYAGASAILAGCSPNAYLTAHPLVSSETQAASTDLYAIQGLSRNKDLLLGYPINMNTPPEAFFDWRRQLFNAGINQFAFNNVGDPYEESPIPFNTHPMEKELISRFSRIYGFNPEETWGFLTNSGTDSNMHGLYMGRTILKNRTGLVPKIYFTKEAHYSIQILRDLLLLDWVEVGTTPDGSMDVESLARRLDEYRNYPALVVATIGTTFKGAIDPIDAIRAKLKGREAFLHLDAALFGGYLPHTKFAADMSYMTAPDTSGKRQPRYDALAVSCHKFFGFPTPAGLFMTGSQIFKEFHASFSKVHDPEYIRHIPGTITCSRDGVKPAEFYFFSSESAFANQAEDAHAMLRNTDYLMKELESHFAQLQPMRANDRSNTVYFRKPSDDIINRYSLATMELEIAGKRETYAHVVVMPHVRKAVLDRFLNDLKQDNRA
jgi:histidine decarboxylase